MSTLVVLEGGEGVGKSTQVHRLFQRLSAEGFRASLTHEPGGTPVGEALRRLVKREEGLRPWAEVFLLLAARTCLVSQVIKPALERGEVVVCDRFAASTLAYQGWGRGLDLDLLRRLNHLATDGLSPDLTVLLDAPVEVGLARRSQENLDVFERESLEFHQRVGQGYRELAGQEPDRWLVVDATLPAARIADIVWERVSPLLRRGG